MSWEIARIAFYTGLIIGAPAFFFFLVEAKKQDDLSEALSHFHERSEKESKSYAAKLTADFEKKLQEKNEILKLKEAELEKIRPLLKYLRLPPTSGEPS